MINFNPDIVDSITNAVSLTIQQLWVVFAVFFALIITFYIIRKLIAIFKKI